MLVECRISRRRPVPLSNYASSPGSKVCCYTELAFSVIVATVVANIHWVYSDLACVAG